MISDFVKGKAKENFPAAIQKGIMLHRAIDNFTDKHEATAAVKKLFRPDYRLYSGAFTDVVYDYFLANDRLEFSSAEALMQFSQNTFDLLEKQQQWFAPRFATMFPYMKSQNWLYHYQFDEGIQKSMEGLRRRALYIKETQTAYQVFLANKVVIKKEYDLFFPQLKQYTADLLYNLLAY